MAVAVDAVVGAFILLALCWLNSDINRLARRVDRLAERIDTATNILSERVARIEGRLGERDHR